MIDPAYHFVGIEPNTYYANVMLALMKRGAETAPRGLRTRELHPTTARILKPRNRIITSMGRVINLPFALAEVIQILGGINDAQALKHYNSKIVEIQGDSPDATGFNAAYGTRMRDFAVAHSPFGGGGVDQLDHVIETLRQDPDSRQASIVLSHPYYDNYERNTKDRACNVYAHAMIRDNVLDWLQIVRSNDAVWGVPYNMMQWTSVQEYVANTLGVPMGHHFLVQDSLHVYEPFYEECRQVEYFNLYDFFESELLPMKPGGGVMYIVATIEEEIRQANFPTRAKWKEIEISIGGYWCAVLQAFHSYYAFKHGEDHLAYTLLPEYREIRLPMLRNYMHWRWVKDQKYSEQIDAAFYDVTSLGIPREEAISWIGLNLSSGQLT